MCELNKVVSNEAEIFENEHYLNGMKIDRIDTKEKDFIQFCLSDDTYSGVAILLKEYWLNMWCSIRLIIG
ncbi:MAG: hypothetical protein Ta2E_01270 [Mycoplasmoidaceae bacterium]|nr:MAG: hypothetical protein Ta2E_01270 [Mycoplasmoidaceae bacterium]